MDVRERCAGLWPVRAGAIAHPVAARPAGARPKMNTPLTAVGTPKTGVSFHIAYDQLQRLLTKEVTAGDNTKVLERTVYARNYVEFEVPEDRVSVVYNPITKATEYTVKGNITLDPKATKFFRRNSIKMITIEELVNYGLENIDTNENVSVPLRDLVFLYKTIEELVRFFHNPMHYPSLEEVKQYFGDKDEGMFSVLCKIRNETIYKMLPEKVHKMIDDGLLSSNEYPFYYKKG
jgi:hypothetical protein